MKNYLIFIALCFLLQLKVSAQNEESIKFVEDLKEEGREQIKRIVSTYDIDDWMISDVVKMVHGEDARSYPILTMNTNHLTDDKVQLSVFIHENAHQFVANDAKDEAENKVIYELKKLYPDPPAPQQKNLYHHIMVAWIEYDALIELFDEKEATAIMDRKINYYMKDDPNSLLFQNYQWYNKKAMNNPQEIAELMNEYGFNRHFQKIVDFLKSICYFQL